MLYKYFYIEIRRKHINILFPLSNPTRVTTLDLYLGQGDGSGLVRNVEIKMENTGE